MKRILFLIIVIFLFLPGIQQRWNILQLKKLGGAYTKREMPELSLKNWLEGSFQKGFDQFIDDHLGFKEVFVRSYNQFFYSIFKEAKSPGCVVGKDGQLFLESYIQDYNGANFRGRADLDHELEQLKYLQDYFKFHGVELLTVYAPGKASMFSDCIPDRYLHDKGSTSNHLYYVQQSKAMGLNHIDLNSYFDAIKDKSPYPLYPPNSVHWTQYGMYLGIDSIAKKIEELKDMDLTDIIIEDIVLSDSIVFSDNDVEVTMNLFERIPQPSMPHVTFGYDKENKDRPKVLVISDSYWMQVYDAEVQQNIFDEGGFWFYNKTAYPDKTPIDSFDIAKTLLEQEVIILMGTEATMHLFPYGFSSKAYELFLPLDKERIRAFYLDAVYRVEEWKRDTKRKAKENKISFEEQVEAEADYMLKEKLKTLSDREKEIMAHIEKIKQTPSLLQTLKFESEKQDIHLDVKLYETALRIIEEKDISTRGNK